MPRKVFLGIKKFLPARIAWADTILVLPRYKIYEFETDSCLGILASEQLTVRGVGRIPDS